MARGRPPRYATKHERLEARRAQVRQHVRTYRQRKAGDNREHLSAEIRFIQETQGLQGTAGSASNLRSRDPNFQTELSKALVRPSVRLPPAMSLENQYKIGYLTLLQDRYLPASNIRYQSEGSVQNGVSALCSKWVIAACDLAEQGIQGVVHDSILAVAFALYDAHENPTAPAKKGLQLYSRALRRFQATIDSLVTGNARDQHDQEALPLACAALAALELIVEKSLSNWIQHMRGMGILIQRNGTENLSRLSQDIVYEYRAINICCSFWTRSCSFLADRTWIDVPWKGHNPQAAGYFQLLMDEAFPILPTMEEVDAVDQLGCLSDLQGLKEKLLIHKQKLEDWHRWLESAVPNPLFDVRSSTWGSEISSPCFPSTMDFRNFPVAVALACFYVFSVVLQQMIADIEWRLLNRSDHHASRDALLASVQLILFRARLACQSLEYFWSQDTRLVGRMVSIFVFEFAFEALLQSRVWSQRLGLDTESSLLDEEIRWCSCIVAKYRAHGLPLYKFSSLGL